MSTAPSTLPTGQATELAFRTAGRARASVHGVLWSFLNVAVSVLLTAVVFVVTSRILSPTDFGAVALASAIVALVGTLIPVAFGEALVQRADLDQRHTDSVFWLTISLAVIASTALYVLSPVLAEATGTPVLAAILPVLSLRLVLDAGLTVPGSLIQRRMQFRHIALRTTLANGAGAVLCLWMVVEDYALWALVFSQITTSLAALIVTLFVAGWKPGLQISHSALGDLRNFGLFAMGGRVLSVARLDQLLLGVVFGPYILGLYFFARRVHQMLCDLTAGAFAPVTNVMIASLQRDPDKRREFYLIACFASASLAFPVFAGLIAIAPTAVPFLFGPQWTEAAFALQCFGVVGLLAGLGTMQSGLIRYLGQPGWWFWYQTAMQLSTLVLILLLYPWGLDAVMIGIVIRTLLLWPVSVRKAQNLLETGLGAYLASIASPAVSATAMVLFLIGLNTLSGIEGGLTLLLSQVLGGAMVYAGVLFAISRKRLSRLMSIHLDRGQTR